MVLLRNTVFSSVITCNAITCFIAIVIAQDIQSKASPRIYENGGYYYADPKQTQLYTGDYREYYDNGTIRLEMQIKNGLPEGTYVVYFENRKPKEIRSYKDSAMSFFKGFITALEKSNSGFDFKKSNYDFKSIINKRFVGIFGEEEIPFTDDDDNIIIKVRLQKIASTERLAQGDIKIPERKLLSDDDREKLEKQAYTDKVVKERQAEKQESMKKEEPVKKVTVNDLVF